MSFTDYAALKAAVATWAARDDLTSNIVDYITIFECSAARRMKVRAQESLTTLTPSSGEVALPTDYLGHRNLTWDGTPNVVLDYVTPTDFRLWFDSTSTGIPRVFTIEASTIKVKPVSDSTNLKLLYYQKTSAVSSALNWLYTSHPDAYLFGTLFELYAANKKLEEALAWKARRDEVYSEIEIREFRERPTGMAIRVKGMTP